MRFIAMASVSCASVLIEPNDIAPVLKRFTIDLDRARPLRAAPVRRRLELEQAAQRARFAACSFDRARVLLDSSRCCRLRDGAAAATDRLVGFKRWHSPSRAPLVLAADVGSVGIRPRGVPGTRARDGAQHFLGDHVDVPMPAMRDAVPGEVSSSITSWLEADRLEDLRAAVALQRRRCPSSPSP